jgi:cell division protein FtsQ
VLDTPEEVYAPEPVAARRRPRRTKPEPRPDLESDFDDDFAGGLPDRLQDAELEARRPRGGARFRFNGKPVRLPKTLWGRVASAGGVLLFLGCMAAVLLAVRSFFLHDPRFVVESSSYIQSVGNAHVTRAQLLSVFGEDVDRNIFNIPLAERRAELERLPWVEHATVMRLLPNHLRILITERVPVAMVRQGTQLSLVDGHGVLLDMPNTATGDTHYSFPVITAGIGGEEPLSTRAARMKLFGQFIEELDGSGESISKKVSEIDLSDPEDVKALLFEGQSDVLVHFGDQDYLNRYHKFEQHLAEWRTQYPKLSSVDMRYDRQVVLDMQPGAEQSAKVATLPSVKAKAGTKSESKPAAKAASTSANKPIVKPAAQVARSTVQRSAKPASRPVAKDGKKPATAAGGEWHMVVVRPHTKAAAALAAKAKPAHSSEAGH